MISPKNLEQQQSALKTSGNNGQPEEPRATVFSPRQKKVDPGAMVDFEICQR